MTPEKINQVIKHIKTLQIQHTDEVIDVSVADSDNAEKESTKQRRKLFSDP